MQKVVNSKFLQLLPFVFLLGPLSLEIYFFLLFLLNIKNLSLKLIEINYFKIILILFFTSVLFSSIFSDHEISFFKGLSYLRFLIYFFVLELVIKFNEKDLKKFCRSALIVIAVLISFNLFQVITGYNLDDDRTTLPIRLEPISGSFITYFSAYIFSYILWNYSCKKMNVYTSVVLILIILTGCLISGERISSLVLLCMIAFFTFLKAKKIFFFILISIVIIPSFLSQYDYSRVTYIEKRIFSFKKDIRNFENSIWAHHFYAAKETWKEKKIIGNGVRSFRIECKKFKEEKKNACATHPHNIYLELLSELGLIGLSLFTLLLINVIYKSLLYIFYNFNTKSFNLYFLIGLTLYLVINYFPIKSFGSFFNNFNSFGFWTLLFFISTISKNIKKLNNRN